MDFYPSFTADPKLLHVRLQGQQGDAGLDHRYRLRVPGEGVVQKLAGTGTASFCSRRGARWHGMGVAGWNHPEAAGRFIKCQRVRRRRILSGDLLKDPKGRVEDLAFDHLGRLHTVVFARGPEAFPAIAEMSYSIGYLLQHGQRL